MAKLKLGPIPDDKPVRLTVELPAQVHRDLVDYAVAIARETPGTEAIEAAKLVAPMLARFMATDRVFAKARRSNNVFVSAKSSTADLTSARDAQSDARG